MNRFAFVLSGVMIFMMGLSMPPAKQIARVFSARPTSRNTTQRYDLPTFEEVHALLAKHADPGWPVAVSRENLGSNWGYSEWDDELESFTVVVHRPTDPARANQTLVHEWAHMLIWDACQESDHDALWGVAFARCYRAVYGDDP